MPARYLLLAIGLWTPAIVPVPAAAPDWGLIFNDDGDLSFTDLDPQESMRKLRALIGSLGQTPVKTLTYSVGAGSDIMYYPTRVASVWGWRPTAGRYASDPRWTARLAACRSGAQNQLDAIRVVGEEARRLGIRFVPSLRMNDSHYCSDPENSPLTGEFWVKHAPRLTLGQSPVAGYPNYRHLLDFSHNEVRAYRLAIAREIIDRYRDLMDGLELDFNRVQIFFPPGTAASRCGLLSDLVADVRRALDDAGQATGRRYWLLVRVPPAVRNCEWSGIEIEAWMRNRLVDVVIPSQLMTLAHDMPVDEFVSLADKTGCRVYPAIYDRNQFSWPFSAQPPQGEYGKGLDRDASLELLRGAAVNYRHMGAAGFQMFNFPLPPRPFDLEVMASLADVGVRPGTDRVFAITPAYWHDREDTYEYRKQIPVELRPGQRADVTIYVGEDLTAARVPTPSCCALRLGLHQAGKTGLDAAAKKLGLEIRLNDALIHRAPLGEQLTLVAAKRRVGGRGHPPATQAYAQVPVVDLQHVRQGKNRLTIALDAATSTETLLVVEAQLGVFFPR